MTRRLLVLVGVGGLVAIGAVVVITRSTRQAMAVESQGLPTTRVERGALDLVVHLMGELRAARQQVVIAPTVGGTLRILTLAESGTQVKAGDVILEFDPADQVYALEQARSELLEAEQAIVQRRATTQAQAAQDKVSLLTEDFNVRRAELDAAVEKDLIPNRDYSIRQATLVEARRTKAQVESDVKTRASMASAGLTVLQQNLAKAKLAAARAQQNIENLVIKAPIDGVVSVRQNQDAAGGFFFSGMVLPQYRVGDTTTPGRNVMDIFDVSRMEIRARVNEQERDNVAPGQPVKVEADVAPGSMLDAKVVAVSGLGQADRSAGPLRMFEVTLSLDTPDPRLRPGTSVEITVQGKTVENALLLPRQAVFERDGKPIVYERTPTGFQAKEIRILHRTESRVAVDGIGDGIEVALVNPQTAATTTAGASTATTPGLAK